MWAVCLSRSNTLVNYPNAFNRAKKVGGSRLSVLCCLRRSAEAPCGCRESGATMQQWGIRS